ncbi:MAG: 30S ribosomal protein S2, partial [Rhodospirillaceae bacterium]|nr:30S ribosomal protein S2 [Rhodospirillaceae bacterium]
AVIDSNSDPKGIDYPVPGNDDSLRAIELYLDLFWGAVLDGLAQEVARTGGDIGEAEVTPSEELPTADAGLEADTIVANPDATISDGGAKPDAVTR